MDLRPWNDSESCVGARGAPTASVVLSACCVPDTKCLEIGWAWTTASQEVNQGVGWRRRFANAEVAFGVGVVVWCVRSMGAQHVDPPL